MFLTLNPSLLKTYEKQNLNETYPDPTSSFYERLNWTLKAMKKTHHR